MKKQSRLNRMAEIYQEPERTDETYGFVTIVERRVLPVDPRRYSTWLKLRQIQSWINRFIQNCQWQNADRTLEELLADELKKAEIQLVRYAQIVEFQEEWTALSRGRSLPAHSKLLCLQPKLDTDGLLRSDGRLKNAKFLSYDVRYPVILPRKSWITKLIIKDFHEKGNHTSGTNQTLAALSARYWVISGREVIRECERNALNADEERRRFVSKLWLHCPFKVKNIA